MTKFYEKKMKELGIEFVRNNGVVIGCQNGTLVRCVECDYDECPMREQ